MTNAFKIKILLKYISICKINFHSNVYKYTHLINGPKISTMYNSFNITCNFCTV